MSTPQPRNVKNAKRDEKKKIKRALKRENKMQKISRAPVAGIAPHPNISRASKLVESYRALGIPVGPMMNAFNSLDTTIHKEAADYAMAMMMPGTFSSRVPDAFSAPTFLFRGRQIVELNAYSTGAVSDYGRFAALIQPHFGSPAQPYSYKIAAIDASATWPSGLNGVQPTWITQFAGRDIRMDQNVQLLTQPQLACYNVSGSGSNGIPFGASVASSAGQSYGLSVGYDGTTGRFYPPPGQYEVFCYITASPTITTLVVSTQNGANYQGTNVGPAGGILVLTTGFLTIPVQTPGSPLPSISFSIAGGTGAIVGTLALVPTFNDSLAVAPTFDYGAIQAYRTVGMTVLASFIGTDFNDGGTISASYLPLGADRSSFFLSNSPLGNYRNHENLGNVTGALRDNSIRTGAFVVWRPDSNISFNIKDPDTVVTQMQPTICISGQLAPTTAPPFNLPTIRLVVDTLYEGTTANTLFPSEPMLGDTRFMDQAQRIMAMVPLAMQNAQHESFLERIAGFLGKALPFGKAIYDNRKPLLEAGRAVLPLAEELAGLIL
jgi:hypothetical protein